MRAPGSVRRLMKLTAVNERINGEITYDVSNNANFVKGNLVSRFSSLWDDAQTMFP